MRIPRKFLEMFLIRTIGLDAEVLPGLSGEGIFFETYKQGNEVP
jgi:hypothetical protein